MRSREIERGSGAAGGFLSLVLVILVVATVYIFAARIWPMPPSITRVGDWIDSQYNLTLWITGIIFVMAQLALAWMVFRYRDHGQPVLQGCSLRIRQGDRMLLEGPSGGGKSTLAALLAGAISLAGARLANMIDAEAQLSKSDEDREFVDACLKAIESRVKSGAEMLLYSVNAITSGSTESQGEVTVRLQHGGRVVNGVGADPDIVVASAKAYLSALNKLHSNAERVAAQS